jgi:hypothetical protein
VKKIKLHPQILALHLQQELGLKMAEISEAIDNTPLKSW